MKLHLPSTRCASAVALTLALSAPAGATDLPGPNAATPPASKLAIGAQLDLFPTVISAVNGEFGLAPQIWVGWRPVRLRLIAAHLQPPDGFTFDEDVVDPQLTAIAATIDYTFGKHFDGFWVCMGVESWMQKASARDGSGSAEWTSGVFTFGGGYIWRFAGNFYMDPWVGLHWILNSTEHQVGNVTYSPLPLSVNASIKIGGFAWLN